MSSLLSSRPRGGEAAQNPGPHGSHSSRGAKQRLEGSLPAAGTPHRGDVPC